VAPAPFSPAALVVGVGDAATPFDAPGQTLCQTCGACCSYSNEWPRFTTEDAAEIDRIPHRLVSASQSGMACRGDRCAALTGKVGLATACAIYDIRPHVCRACEPGDDACLMARARFGL